MGRVIACLLEPGQSNLVRCSIARTCKFSYLVRQDEPDKDSFSGVLVPVVDVNWYANVHREDRRICRLALWLSTSRDRTGTPGAPQRRGAEKERHGFQASRRLTPATAHSERGNRFRSSFTILPTFGPR